MPRRVVVIDNHDSFTYNLVQSLALLGASCEVRLSDRTRLDEILRLAPQGILLSPGPGTPDDAGVSLEVVRTLGGRVPLLGVCLGHQTIGQAFGGIIVRAPALMHGKTSAIEHDGRSVFTNIPSPFEATRYHSLILERTSLPECLQISASTADGLIMGLRHRNLPIEGVQFHPESILTEHGESLLANWLKAL